MVVGPQNIPRHLLYELSWVLATGLPRSAVRGEEECQVKPLSQEV
jgi:hypothetical protein